VRHGGVIIFPTDTAFGIGCRIDDAVSVQKLFKIRRRAEDKAVPVLVSSIKMAKEYSAEIDPKVLKVMGKYWPGGLTIVLKCRKDKVPALVRGGGDTIGLRIPNHKTALDLVRQVGLPILAPSANFSGKKTPFKISDLDPELVRRVDFVMPGKCSLKKASTVFDTTSKPWRVLRQGAVRFK
jgi:L-threonylcarbamoyladenylate synthase